MFKRREPYKSPAMRIRHALLVSAAAAFVSLGCIVEAPTANNQPQLAPGVAGPAPQQRAAVVAPPLQIKVGANLSDRVEVLGTVVEPGVLTPGLPAKVSVVMKVLEQIPEDWMIFVHIEDAEGRMERLNVDHKPMNGQNPTNQWKKGETLKDEFQLYLPPGAQAKAINVFFGFWNPANDQRMKINNLDQVKHDGKDRLLIGQIPVGQ